MDFIINEYIKITEYIKIFDLRCFPANTISDQREESGYLLVLWGKNTEHKHF